MCRISSFQPFHLSAYIIGVIALCSGWHAYLWVLFVLFSHSSLNSRGFYLCFLYLYLAPLPQSSYFSAWNLAMAWTARIQLVLECASSKYWALEALSSWSFVSPGSDLSLLASLFVAKTGYFAWSFAWCGRLARALGCYAAKLGFLACYFRAPKCQEVGFHACPSVCEGPFSADFLSSPFLALYIKLNLIYVSYNFN